MFSAIDPIVKGCFSRTALFESATIRMNFLSFNWVVFFGTFDFKISLPVGNEDKGGVVSGLDVG